MDYKCLLSPLVQIHLWRTYHLPVLVSGLSALPIRPTTIKPIAVFQNKIMRGILKLSNTSHIPAIYFLCQKYSLPSPLGLLKSGSLWTKQAWNTLVRTRVTVWYEKEFRRLSLSNSKMQYRNVQLNGLSGAPHPCLLNINTTQDVKKTPAAHQVPDW